jgi:phospholipid/cholesterol/gamma-HCH transport system substrate-binding protein
LEIRNVRNWSIGGICRNNFLYWKTKKSFGSTFRIQANFKNVSGLTVGNNVRFSGINIGTVDEVQLVSDSSVVVSMTIEKKYKNSLKQMLKLALDQTD